MESMLLSQIALRQSVFDTNHVLPLNKANILMQSVIYIFLQAEYFYIYNPLLVDLVKITLIFP